MIKFLLDDTSQGRFRREYKLTQGVENRWTPRSIDRDFELYPFWIAFEYVEADTLREVISDSTCGPLTGEALDRFGRQLWEARSYFDGVGMAHRDLSANNVMMRRGDGRVVIVDWGTGRQEGAEETQTTGWLPYTPGFGAPEQVLGIGDVGRSEGEAARLADVWGWGSVTYYAATGRTVLPGTRTGYEAALRSSTPIDWSAVPERWLPAIQAALQVNDRHPDAVSASLPLSAHERKLEAAIAKAELAELALEAELDRQAELAEEGSKLDGQPSDLDRERLAELEKRVNETSAQLLGLRPVVTKPVDERPPPPPAPSRWPIVAAFATLVVVAFGVWGIVNRPAGEGTTGEPPASSPTTHVTRSRSASGPEPCWAKGQVAGEVGVLVEQAQETCAFQMVSGGGNAARCPRNWICTYDSNGVRTVQDGGDGVRFNATAATFRFRPAYYETEPAAPGRSICDLFKLDNASRALNGSGAPVAC